jgi:hypothetical protein
MIHLMGTAAYLKLADVQGLVGGVRLTLTALPTDRTITTSTCPGPRLPSRECAGIHAASRA